MPAGTSTILIVGGTGATGRHVVEQMLDRGHNVRIVARRPEKLPETVRTHTNATVVEGTVLSMNDADLSQQVHGCDAIISCLGHSVSWRGIFGPPWRLVARSTRRLWRTVQATDPDRPVRFVLMSSTGCRNRDAQETVSIPQRVVVRAIRTLLPPHADNEAAMEFLRTEAGQTSTGSQWAIVRPDTLINEVELTPYDAHPAPIRSAIFNPGETSRINVAHFMAELATDHSNWTRWVGQMPVIYNRETP